MTQIIMNQTSVAALENLKNFPRVIDEFNTSKRSAVLVPLVVNPVTGKLEVILTVRSSNLRTNAGDVAFPGGKQDPEDVDLIATAKREAFEEVGIPPSASEVLTVLTPVISRHFQVVTPVVAFCPSLTTSDIHHVLHSNPDEVAAIFTTPLEHFLDPPPELYDFFDMQWMSSEHRVHRFDLCGSDNYVLSESGSRSPGQQTRSSSVDEDFRLGKSEVSDDNDDHRQGNSDGDQRSGKVTDNNKDKADDVVAGWPVYGLTAWVIIEVAKIAYGRKPSYQEYAANQETDLAVMARWHNMTFTKSLL